ncbi:carbohydrate ABC transporter permease [Lacrimispora indolis]|uniref:carbohydrate ABC transporter permease n=1 Tax=Lacrimispora indolis TaxID=69825 RepID=UPI00041F9854|nr:sugar ABC transporter permease [[Clostridium] methoxybenzovorans]
MKAQLNTGTGGGLRAGQTRTAWLFCAPALVPITLFIILPFCMSIIYSFTNRMLVQKAGKAVEFVGLKNFIKLFANGTARQAFLNTAVYALLVVPVIVILGIVLAVLVNNSLKGVKLFRTIYFSPQIITMTVVAIVWSFIFSPGPDGLMNSALRFLGLQPQAWLQDSRWALFCIAVMYVWQSLGMEMLIILGGLQFISEDLYEAGRMDGCNAFQRFWYITVPMLKNTLVYVLISTTINTLKLFTQVYVLTNGGPKGSTTSVIYLLYKSGFVNNQLGYSSAIAVVFFLIVLVISLIQNRILGRDN